MGRRVAAPNLENRVREIRLEQQLSQQALAERAGLTRQALSAIESGQYVPNTVVTLCLARALGCRVEDLFVLPECTAPHPIHLAGPLTPGARRLAVVNVRGRWVGHPLSDGKGISEGFVSADGLTAPDGTPATTRLLAPPEQLERTALVLGCDPSLGILGAHLGRRTVAARLLWLAASSQAALDAVARGEAHVAGSHLRDPETGEYNLPQAGQLLARTGGLVVAFARWEQGFVVATGNPKGLRCAADLVRSDVRLINRDPGSGSRALLDELLAREGVPAEAVSGYDRVVGSHLAVARAVSAGAADVGIGLRATAYAFGLDFIPLAEARFDFVVPSDQVDHPAVALLLDLLQSRALRVELGALPGYDVSHMGTVVASFPAAA